MLKILFLIAIFFNIANAQNINQLLSLELKSENSTTGILKLYEKSGKQLILKKEFENVLIGKNGASFEKLEGDKKTPLGLFKLSTTFGYDENSFKMPYIKVSKEYHCVDDSNSKFYNKIINSNFLLKDYNSFEYMKRDDLQYKFGVVIDYNDIQAKNRGSCIFIHLKSKNKTPTAGCVALEEDEMIYLLNWLEKRKNPHILIWINR